MTVALLDPKRANNISIILSRIKLPFDQIRKAIIELDADVRRKTRGARVKPSAPPYFFLFFTSRDIPTLDRAFTGPAF